MKFFSLSADHNKVNKLPLKLSQGLDNKLPISPFPASKMLIAYLIHLNTYNLCKIVNKFQIIFQWINYHFIHFLWTNWVEYLGKILCCRILTTNHKLVWLRFDSARNENETLFLFATQHNGSNQFWRVISIIFVHLFIFVRYLCMQ